MNSDLRRKIEKSDYQKIQFEVNVIGMTIREVANERGISTKYVSKILDGLIGEVPQWEPTLDRRFSCSGCLRIFTNSGLWEHFNIWTSGNNPLACITTMPG